MRKIIYKDLQGKLNQYLSEQIEEEIRKSCVCEESIPYDLSDKKNMVQAPQICAPTMSSYGKKRRSLDDVTKELEETFSQKIFRLIDQKERDEVEVYKSAGLSRQVFSKIRSNQEYMPKKKTALALCIALHLSLDETEDLLNKAGFALSQSSLFDMIIKFFIEEELYDMNVINEALNDHGEQLLVE